jgi:hypothetical protein
MLNRFEQETWLVTNERQECANWCVLVGNDFAPHRHETVRGGLCAELVASRRDAHVSR